MEDPVTAERQRVAARLHDGPLQALTAAQMLLDSTLPALGGQSAEVRNRLEQALRAIRDANAACRAIVDDLVGDA